MRALLPVVALIGSTALGSAAFANTDGLFNVNYNDISFELSQFGGYGELIVSPSGYGNMAFGTCTVNFTRDEAGNPKDYAPVVQGNSANCPDKIAFSIKPQDDGFYALTFTEGDQLKLKNFELFPLLLPMNDNIKVTAPQGFDILGMTIGQTRAEVEAILAEKGFTRNPGSSDKLNYTSGHSKAVDVWGRGVSDLDASQSADYISVTYTAILEGQEAEEKVEYLLRNWRINAADNLSKATLEKSLFDKHGKPKMDMSFIGYDHEGTFVPAAFQPVCRKDLHLQSVSSVYRLPAEVGEVSLNSSCGAFVKYMMLEDLDVAGRANFLKLELGKGDVAYESFWNVQSVAEEKALKERYELQANMTGAAPEL